MRFEDSTQFSGPDLKVMIDSIPTLVYTMTPDCELEFVNRQVIEYFGKSLEVLKRWDQVGIIYPEDLPNVRESIRRSIEFGEPHEVQHRLRRADGIFRWFQARALPLKDAAGHIVRWFAVLNDIEDLKRAKEASFAREADLRQIVNSIPGLVATMRATGEAEFVNQRILDYTGWQPEMFSDWRPLVHPEDLAGTVEKWVRSLDTGAPYDSTHRLLGADGEYRWFQTRGVALNDVEGRRVRWFMLLTDLEDHVKAEEDLRESKAFLLEAQRLSQTGSWKHDLATGEVTFTPEVARIFAIDPEVDRAPAELFFSRVHPDDRPAEAANYERAVQAKGDLNSNYRIVRPDGSISYVHNIGHPKLSATGEVIAFVGTAMDVTEQWHARTEIEQALSVIRRLTVRLKAENLALRERERELNLIVETIPGLIWCASTDGYVTYVNRQVLEYCGATLESFFASGWTSFLHPDDLSTTLKLWQHAVRNEELHEVQYRLRRSDGAYRWFHVVGCPARNGEGQVIRWYGLLIDIHERRSAEETLRRAEARLVRATQVATAGELSASIAHEVNQPLAAVVANAHAGLRWLSAEPPNIMKAREAAERILRDSKEASAIIQRVRTLFKRGPFERTSVDVNQLVGEVLHLLQTETVRKGVRVEVELADHLPAVEGDRVQLQQVVLNLVLNGIEAMETNGGRQKTLRVSSTRGTSGEVLVSVEDCGVGVAEPDKMFEAFFTTKKNGMGMGLAISRSIIEAHEGRLWVEPGASCGAIFRFSIPARQ
nr:PAS domain-containing protein [uncultured Paludibaculum sp.]